MHPLLRELEKEQMKKNVPAFKVGDTMRISVRVDEGDKTRTQLFEGICILRAGSGIRENFTVRRISFGEGVERNFPVHSPTVQKIEVVRTGKVRRSKLYYLRKQSGKKGRIEEDRKTDAATAQPQAERATAAKA
ncbi:MAG: 50S ribosomal protein L19 [Candidatus Omnitrophica bacterium]|nr:50S ribosomal protein L19 [Candidatus Omnitrophota bacterium]